jgi:hypothetical protein
MQAMAALARNPKRNSKFGARTHSNARAVKDLDFTRVGKNAGGGIIHSFNRARRRQHGGVKQ